MSLTSDLLISLRLAARAQFFSFSLWLLAALIAVAFLAAGFSGRHPATISLDVGLSTIRLGLPVLAVLLLQELLSREFDRKLFLNSLTYPRPRHQFLLGRILAIGALLVFLLGILSGLLATITAWLSETYTQSTPPDLGLPYIITVLFIALDLLVVLAIGALISVVTRTPSFVLVGTLGFTLVARSFSEIVSLLARDSTLVGNPETYQASLSLLGYVLPDLAALDVRMITLYGRLQFLPPDWPLRVASTFAYVMAVFALAVWALNRKRLS